MTESMVVVNQNEIFKVSSQKAGWFSSNAFFSGAGVRGSNLELVKSYTVLPTTYRRCDISLKGAVLSGRNDVEMNPANSLLASA